MSDAYDRIGAARLEAVIADFVGRMARDPMIGFFFARVDLARLEAARVHAGDSRSLLEFATGFVHSQVRFWARD